MRKETRLRNMLNDPVLSFVMEAHNALSARIVQEAGFEAIWASGLSIAATMGLADRNEASWTQVVEIAEHMADHVNVPVLLDGDSGFGSFNNVARLVRKLCQKGIAGVCIEDKLFPKVNSFVEDRQQLSTVEDFIGKIRAAKDAQTLTDFCVVARVEALIAGLPMNEALERAQAYSEAGADAILIHSKKESGEEIIQFANQWCKRVPLVIVPTKYYQRPAQDYVRANISTVIWVNQSLRAAITAIRHPHGMTEQAEIRNTNRSDEGISAAGDGGVRKWLATQPVLDWTDNYEEDAQDEVHRPAHLRCAPDGLDRRFRFSFLSLALSDARECVAPRWRLVFFARRVAYLQAELGRG